MSISHEPPPSSLSGTIVLVDRGDLEIGTTDKLTAHREGALHRAFSIFVFDRLDRLLLQCRASGKYHSGGLWSNTCCSHPRPGETPLDAGRRRLQEEMGFACNLADGYSFVYRAELDGGLVEHELDHVLVGRFDGTPSPDPNEVQGWRWERVGDIRRDIARSPGNYTVWLRLVLEEMQGAPASRFPAETRDLFSLLT